MLPVLSNVAKAGKNYVASKGKKIVKSVKRTIDPMNAVRLVKNQIVANIAKESPDLAALLSAVGSEYSAFKREYGEVSSKQKKTKNISESSNITKPPSTSDVLPTNYATPVEKETVQNNTIQEVKIDKDQFKVFESIEEKILDIEKKITSIEKIGENTLDVNNNILSALKKNKFPNRYSKNNDSTKLTTNLIKPKEDQKKEESSFLTRILESIGISLMLKGILSIGSGMKGIIGAITTLGSTILGIAPTIIGGLASVLGGLIGKLGMSLPELPSAKLPSKTQIPNSKTGKPQTTFRDSKTGRFSKAPKQSLTQRFLKQSPKIGKAATSAGRVLMSPQVLVGAGSLAAGTALGYSGLQAVSDVTDKISGEENTIGKALLKLSDKLTGKDSFSYEKNLNTESKEPLKFTVYKTSQAEMDKFSNIKKTKEVSEKFETESKARVISPQQQQTMSGQVVTPVQNVVNNTNVISTPLRTRNDAAWSDVLLTSKIVY